MKHMLVEVSVRSERPLVEQVRCARQTFDEYFAALNEPVFLHRIDDTTRLVVKQEGA